MTSSSGRPGVSRCFALAGAAALAVLVAGCASVPPPTGAMARAQNQLQAAQEAKAADYDPVDLDFAKARFQQAQVAMDARKYAQAADLAEESLADGRLAQTKAQVGALREQIRSKTEENARLRARLLDNPAPPSAAPAERPSTTELPEQVLPAPASSEPDSGLPPVDDGYQGQGGQGGDL